MTPQGQHRLRVAGPVEGESGSRDVSRSLPGSELSSDASRAYTRLSSRVFTVTSYKLEGATDSSKQMQKSSEGCAHEAMPPPPP